MNDTNRATIVGQRTRPFLLTAICILSSIFGAWGLYEGIHSLTDDPQKVIQEAEAGAEEQRTTLGKDLSSMTIQIIGSGLDMTRNEAANATPLGIGRLLVSALSLLGIALMWNLRKAGFWLYLLASVGGLALLWAFAGDGMMAKIVVALLGFFSLLFIILYAVNLKYMH
jgi:hypothetical protein